MTREEEIEKVATHYAELVEWEYNIPASIKRIVKSAYRMGTKWSDEHPNLENKWHDASEEPRCNEIMLGMDSDGVSLYKWCGQEDSWDSFCGITELIRWAYINDLLPKGGEK